MSTSDLLDSPEYGHAKLPKYVKLANYFSHLVESGALQPGDRLPSLTQVGEQFGVSQHTFQKVQALLEQEGIIVRQPGRGVFVAEPKPKPISNTIGVVWGYDDGRDAYHAQILKGIKNAAHENSLELLLIPEIGATRERLMGIVICRSIERHKYKDQYLRLLELDVPVVCLLYPYGQRPSVLADDFQGTADAVRHLLDLGHRRVGFLTVGCQKTKSDALSKKRLLAYRDTLLGHGIEAQADWVRPLFEPRDIVQGRESFRDQGRKKMTEWLRHGWAESGCTALLTQNDDTAIGVIEALREAGYRVPEEVSVVGFDGAQGTDYFSPRLTTVLAPLQSIGESSVELLIQLARRKNDGPSPERGLPNSMVLPMALQINASTGPALSKRGEAWAQKQSRHALPAVRRARELTVR